jgi:hypothetical protein
MKPQNKLIRIVFWSIFSAFIILLSLSFISYPDNKTFFSILIAYLIATINFLIGFTAFKYGIKKKEKTFIISVLGGIVLRLIFSLSLVLISLLFLELNPNSFIFSIFFFYILYISIEIVYLNLRKD